MIAQGEDHVFQPKCGRCVAWLQCHLEDHAPHGQFFKPLINGCGQRGAGTPASSGEFRGQPRVVGIQ